MKLRTVGTAAVSVAAVGLGPTVGAAAARVASLRQGADEPHDFLARGFSASCRPERLLQCREDGVVRHRPARGPKQGSMRGSHEFTVGTQSQDVARLEASSN